MSCYCKMKVLRIPYEPEAWGWKDPDPGDFSWDWDYVEKHFSEDVFNPYRSEVHTFTFAPTESAFVDYILEYEGDFDGEYGKVRELYDSEKDKYRNIFQQLGPIDMDKVHLVEFCWDNATEAPDYYDIEIDPFYDPV